MKLAYITADLIVGFILLVLWIKVIGRKIIKRATPFTFISSIVLGEIIGNAIYNDKISFYYIMYSMVLWGALLITVEYLGQKFLVFRGMVEGKPSALIRNGVVDRQELKKNRMNINQLQSLLRQSETFSIREVAYCYLEPNGSLSILKKTKYQKTTQEDFNMPPKPVCVPVTIIRDGEVLWDEITDLGYDEAWLTTQLNSHNITDYKNIFIAEWLEGEGLFVQPIS
ncbi:DUF421 domain-containing protein [Neobacillus sp. GCM10023253]|uniref:DUF421 domain-containing protein n=1 Tax=Neobacillus sp. GCM10023253 TaxID=3252644 RepID=UPI00360D08FE